MAQGQQPKVKRKTGLPVGGDRRSFQPTNDQRVLVANLVAFGLTQTQIALLVTHPNGNHIDEDTLRKHFARELADGLAKANAQIAGALFTAAREGNTTAQIFWLKSRARWKETNVLEVGGIPGQPIEITVNARQRILDDLNDMEARRAALPVRENGADDDARRAREDGGGVD